MSDRGKSYLQNMSGVAYQETRFCDAVIVVDGVEFHVHKFILCHCSSYFRDIFLLHSATDKKVFEIPRLSAEMMALIIEFAYEGTVSVTEDSVQQLIQVAPEFYITDLVQTCCNFLVEKLSIKNCIGFWQLNKFCSCAELRQKTFQFVIKHFEEVVFSEEFQQLSLKELTDILGKDELNVSQESTVYEAIVKWIAHAPADRRRHIAELLSKVRLALTSVDFINSISSSTLVMSDIMCMLIVKHALNYKCFLSSLSSPRSIMSLLAHDFSLHSLSCTVSSNLVARPRIPNAILLAIGGFTNSTFQVVEAYDIRSNRWNNVTVKRGGAHVHYGTALYNGCVYGVGAGGGGGGGGSVGVKSSNTMCRLDLKTHTWHEAAPMYDRRVLVAVTVLNGYIYAIGGADGIHVFRTAQRYRPETNQWSFIASMGHRRSAASCTVLQNKIYICGGYGGNNILSTCEYYTPEDDQWTSFASMSIPRSGIGVAAYADQIFAVGGYDDSSQRLSIVEAYNPQTDTWRTVASMLASRCSFGIAVIENKLFAVGGFYNSTLVEYYDANTDKWSMASDLGIGRGGLSCCVVSDLPNIAEYIPSNISPPLFHEEEETD